MSDPKIHVRFSGECSGCGKPIQSTPTLTISPKPTEAWIRCNDCDRISLCNQSGTEVAGQVGDRDD